MSTEALIFDAADTLADTEETHRVVFNNARWAGCTRAASSRLASRC